MFKAKDEFLSLCVLAGVGSVDKFFEVVLSFVSGFFLDGSKFGLGSSEIGRDGL